MARKPVQRHLPSLKVFFPNFRGFPKKEHHLHLATEKMRKVAQRLRKSRNQPFYSMREAARFWSVPLTTILITYQHLEDEGLIARVRGSRTVLLGKSIQSQHPARSIVSIPIALSSVISSHFTRRFCDRISEELWKYHFVANLMLVKKISDTSADFARRLVNQSDIVIWLFPDREVKDTMLTARDHGVQNITLRPADDNSLPANYFMDWTSIYQKMILAWKEAGIHHIVVPKPTTQMIQPRIKAFLELVRENEVNYTLAEPNVADLRDKIEHLRKKRIRLGCAILEHELSHHLCNSEPDVIAQLTARCRFLFGRGRVHAPPFFKRDVRADVIAFAGDEIAVRVASDLSRRRSKLKPARLYPQWMPDSNLGEIFV